MLGEEDLLCLCDGCFQVVLCFLGFLLCCLFRCQCLFQLSGDVVVGCVLCCLVCRLGGLLGCFLLSFLGGCLLGGCLQSLVPCCLSGCCAGILLCGELLLDLGCISLIGCPLNLSLPLDLPNVGLSRGSREGLSSLSESASTGCIDLVTVSCGVRGTCDVDGGNDDDEEIDVPSEVSAEVDEVVLHPDKAQGGENEHDDCNSDEESLELGEPVGVGSQSVCDCSEEQKERDSEHHHSHAVRHAPEISEVRVEENQSGHRNDTAGAFLHGQISAALSAHPS